MHLFFHFRVYPIHDSHTILAIKIACYHRESGPIKDFYRDHYKNLFSIDGEKSKWWVFNEVKEEIQKAISNIQTYIEQITGGELQSLNISSCCTDKKVFESFKKKKKNIPPFSFA